MVKTCKGVVIMKKGISQSKVQRMRNLVSGDYSSKTKIRSGYSTKRVVRKEGDVWEERGKSWTIKNGLKQTINKLDKFRIESKPPLCCPKCNKRMKSNLDKSIYMQMKFCSDCLAKYERKLHAEGLFDKYKDNLIQGNFDYWLEGVKANFEDYLKQRNSTNYISEAGDIEDWSGGLSDEELRKTFNLELENILEKRNEIRQKHN